jgi:hypothetical protein
VDEVSRVGVFTGSLRSHPALSIANNSIFGTDALYRRYQASRRLDQFRFIFNAKCSPQSDAFR